MCISLTTDSAILTLKHARHLILTTRRSLTDKDSADPGAGDKKVNRDPASQLMYGSHIHINRGKKPKACRRDSNMVFMWNNSEACPLA